jgi:hypothetical protein
VWHKEEMLECIDYLSVQELKAFIPRLLASLKVCPVATPKKYSMIYRRSGFLAPSI